MAAVIQALSSVPLILPAISKQSVSKAADTCCSFSRPLPKYIRRTYPAHAAAAADHVRHFVVARKRTCLQAAAAIPDALAAGTVLETRVVACTNTRTATIPNVRVIPLDSG